MIKEITSFVAAEKSHYEDVANRVTTGDQSLSGTLQTIANSVQANGDATRAIVQGGSVPVVKSVQRGVTRISSYEEVTVNIGYINPNKTFIFTHGAEYGGHVTSVTNTSFNLSGSGVSNTYLVGWQVIEFY